jgi:Ca-activated chloride channel family protein
MPARSFSRGRRRLGRHALALAGGVSASAVFAQPRPQLVPPPWRPPQLQVAGAERLVRLESLKIEVEVSGGVAETRVEMVFLNPNTRTLEGKLQFPLAPGQVVSGFAIDVDGRLRDAVPVEKARAEQVFEDITRRRVDPGLLQTLLGNNYELRIYPLLAGKTRTVMLTIVEPASLGIEVPLAYAARVTAFELSLRFPGAARAPVLASAAALGLVFARDPRGGFSAHALAADIALPTLPLSLRLPAPGGDSVAITTEERDGRHYFTLELPVAMATAPRALPRCAQIVWDASASSVGRAFDREFALLDAYFGRACDIAVELVRVADTASPPDRFAVGGGDWSALRRALESTVYDGASHLGAVRHDGTSTEALWFSDGLATYGAPWQLAFPVPVFAIQSAASGDPATLQALADASGGRAIDLARLSRQAAADALLRRGTELAGVTAHGATDIVVQSQSAASGWLVLAGVLTAASADITLRLRDAGGKVTTRRVHVDARQNPSRLAAVQFARLTIASLEGRELLNQLRIREIGQRFGLATRETSLLVLELASDYARHEIEPPIELRDAYERLLAGAAKRRTESDAARLAQVVRRFEERAAWWNRDFPKGTPPAPLQVAAKVRAAGGALDELVASSRAMPAPAPTTTAPMAPALARPAQPAGIADERSVGASSKRTRREHSPSAGEAAPTIAMALTPAANASATLQRLKAATAADWQHVYFDERRANAANVGFFLDAGEFFIGKGQRAFGLRVLSNLAEMDLQNRQVLRLLAYRLQQAGEVDTALPIFERVLELAPNEPQSHRDLGLALAQAGQRQRAVERLYAVVTGAWDPRFADIDLIALTELNAVVEKARRDGRPVDTTAIEPRLLKNMPLDVRVVLAWDADNTDVDLHVVDPNGDEVYYGRALSYQGGAITHDATGGYGPEEFALRIAKPGKYRVEANFFGHRQQVLTTSTGLMLWLSSGFATPQQQDQRTTIRVRSERGERVVLGEFEVRR